MVTCPECGTQNADDEQFCGGCGTYLEWVETRAAEPADAGPAEDEPVDEPPDRQEEPTAATAAPAPEPPAGPAPAGPPVAPEAPTPVDPPDAVERPAATADRPATADRAASTAAGATESLRVDPSTPVAPSNGRPSTEQVEASTAAALVAPSLVAPPRRRRARRGAEAEPSTTAHPGAPVPGAAGAAAPSPAPVAAATRPGQPQAVKPGAAKPRPARRPVPAQEEPPAPGDLICGACGAGNTPTRKFCRRCGASLAEAKVQPRRGWWSRLWRPEPKRGPVAGTRPNLRRRRFPVKPVVTLLVLGALVATGFYFRPELERAYVAVLDRAQGNVPINPTSIAASSEHPDHPAENARDGTTNLAWMPAAPGDATGQYLEMGFAQPFRLVRVLVLNGASDVEEDYLAQDAPRQLTITTTTVTGATADTVVELQDRAGLQDVDVVADDVVAVRLTIDSTYRPTPETYAALAEVEFRGRE